MTTTPIETTASGVHEPGLRNKAIWDRLYEHGNYMHYPAELLFKLLLRYKANAGTHGRVVDYGCGSGNNTECLVRLGFPVLAVDVSEHALQLVAKRLPDTSPALLETYLIDPAIRDVSQVIPKYSNVVSWGTLGYDAYDAARSRFASLIAGMSPGGFFIAAVHSKNDDIYRESTPLPDGSRSINSHPGQAGAVISFPNSEAELVGWCTGLEIDDVMTWTVAGQRSTKEHLVICGRKV